MADRRSAPIGIGGRPGPDDGMCISQSLPCKPASLAKPTPEMELPPLELPKSSPATNEAFLAEDEERSLIRYADAEITAEELSSTPAQREMYLSQSCPSWSTFQMPRGQEKAAFEPPEETAQGAVAVPGHAAIENVIEAEVGIIGKSPTILESFKMYNAAGSVGLDEELGKTSLEEIAEDEPPRDDDDDEAQFSLEA